MSTMGVRTNEFDPVSAFKTTANAPPAFSMRGKTIYGDWERSYFDVYGEGGLGSDLTKELGKTKNSAPKWSMRRRTPTPLQRNQQPGPGTYSVSCVISESHPTLSKEPNYGFGSSSRENASGRIMLPSTPSPQDYQSIPEGIRGPATTEKSPAFSMRGKWLDKSDPEYREARSPRPSPHSFEVSSEHLNATKASAPRYSMRSKSPTRVSSSSSPGPGAYDAQTIVAKEHPTKNTAPAWKFGSSHRDNVSGRIMLPRTPSPNQYQAREEGKIGRVNHEKFPSYSMRVKPQDQKDPEYRQSRSPRPSPHSHEVTSEHLSRTKRASSPKWSMSSRSSSPMNNDRKPNRYASPGPGSYSIQSTVGRSTSPSSKWMKSGGGWHFGSSKRFDSPKPDERVHCY